MLKYIVKSKIKMGEKYNKQTQKQYLLKRKQKKRH